MSDGPGRCAHPELLPCPVCGGKAIERNRFADYVCYECECGWEPSRAEYWSFSAAAEDWNRGVGHVLAECPRCANPEWYTLVLCVLFILALCICIGFRFGW